MKNHSDEWIISHLQSADLAKQDRAFVYLHKQMSQQVANYILKNSGKETDIDDVFQDGLIYLYKLVRQNREKTIRNIEAYFFTICRNLWLKELKRRKKSVDLEESHHLEATDDLILDKMMDKEKKNILMELMNTLGDSCQKILIYYYFEKLSMKEIAQQMNLANDQVAKNKKSNCLKQLRNIILGSDNYKFIFKKN
ncbi:MAG: RNA polymerase sigma factor [Saprospiraceae bacterium]